MNRAELRGKPLDWDCKMSRTVKETDGNTYCYGTYDCMTDEPIEQCRVCKAFVNNIRE